MTVSIEIGSVYFPDSVLVFEPYIKKIDDNFKSDWNQEYVLGRMDSISTFQRTRREINLSFDVPAKDFSEAKQQRTKLQLLASFLYPTYKVINNTEKAKNTQKVDSSAAALATANANQQQLDILNTVSANPLKDSSFERNTAIMSGSPILFLKINNLVQSADGGYLYGFVNSFSLNPYEDMGFFVSDDKREIYPKAHSVGFQFNVIHTNPIGWDLNTNTRLGGIYKLGE